MCDFSKTWVIFATYFSVQKKFTIGETAYLDYFNEWLHFHKIIFNQVMASMRLWSMYVQYVDNFYK